jgi:hypothetical protein
MRYSSSAPPDIGVRQTNSSAALFFVVYRSRAVHPLTGQDLQGLMQAARARNRREAITGILLYDEGRFLQWLEGPADGISRVMCSIRGDARHTDIELLRQGPTSERSFSDWDMGLVLRNADNALQPEGVIEPSPELMRTLQRNPGRAANHLLQLAKASSRNNAATPAPESPPPQMPMVRTTASVLRNVFLNNVVPKLLDRHGTADDRQEPTLFAARAAELAELLLASDETASREVIHELRGNAGGLAALSTPLFEAAARRLGDLWAEDLCSEFDLTLGLVRLQTAARLLAQDPPQLLQGGPQPNVLIVPAPGEAHQLVASLDTQRLLDKGWAPRHEFPADDGALEKLVAGTWVDVLDLSLSAAFHRSDQLPRLRTSIALARRASINSDLLVVVGGRVFAEHRSEGLEVGADVASRTSQGVEKRMLAGLVKRR